jgi:hypothetical protein
MAGISVAIADPIPLVNEYDDRVSVKALIEDNRKQIDEVKQCLQADSLYNAGKHDDLWILRFLLSHKKNKKAAIKAAKATLAFRNRHKLDENDIRHFPSGPLCKSDANKRYLKYIPDGALQFTVPDIKRGVIAFLNVDVIDQHELTKNVAREDWLPTYCYVSEWSFQWLDYITRTTGLLTKSVRFVDLKKASLSKFSHEMLKRDAEAMSVMEDCYPQLLQSIFVCNAPVWIQIPWRFLRPLLPTRVVNKFDFITPEKSANERNRLLKYISEDNLPVRFGGNYEPWPVVFLPPVVN